jgi:hypothetical protein
MPAREGRLKSIPSGRRLAWAEEHDILCHQAEQAVEIAGVDYLFHKLFITLAAIVLISVAKHRLRPCPCSRALPFEAAVGVRSSWRE